jgi:integrase
MVGKVYEVLFQGEKEKLIMALQKTNTPGIYKSEGKTRTSYVVMHTVRVKDPEAVDGWKWKLKGKTFPTYDKAVGFKVKNQADNRRSRNLEPTELTMEQLCKEYLEYKQPHLKRQTYLFYKSHVDLYIIPALGNKEAANILPAEIRKALNTWEQKLYWTTLKGVYATLKRIFKFGRREHDFRENPMEKVDGVKSGEHQEVKIFKAAEVSKILEAANIGLEKILLTVASHTGLRPGELCGLLWDAVDLKAGKLSVKLSLTELPQREGGAVLDTPKTKAGRRTLKLAPDVVRQLREWKLQCQPTIEGFVFVNVFGKPVKQISVYYMLKRVCKRAGVPFKSMKTFRHTFASGHVIIRTPLTELSQMMGHASKSFTLDTYGHFGEDTSLSQDNLADWIKEAKE